MLVGSCSSQHPISSAPYLFLNSAHVRSTDPNDFPGELLPTFLTSLASFINGPHLQSRDIATQVLNAVLGKKQFRPAVWKQGDCISG